MRFDLSNKYQLAKFRVYAEKLIGKACKVELTEKQKNRTIDQNSLMWLWLACIQDETGEDKQNLHEFFKSKFLGFKNQLFNGEEYQVKETTTKLNTTEMTNYLDNIKRFASVELGIYLPTLQDVCFSDFFEIYKNKI